MGSDGEVLADPEPELSSDIDVYCDSSCDSGSDNDGGNSLRADLKRARDDEVKEAPPAQPPVEPPDGRVGAQDAWEILEIIDQRHRKRGRVKQLMYLVRWAGEHPDDWLHHSRLRGAPEVVEAWKRKRNAVANVLELRQCKVYHQFNAAVSEAEFVPTQVDSEKVNPFAHLFNVKLRPRVKPPVGEKSMLKHEFSEYFQKAAIKEKLENLHWKAYEEVPRSSVPFGKRILRPMTAYDIKYNDRGEIEKFKTRVCLDGSRTIVPDNETYECIASFATIRFLLCFAARYGMDVVQTDTSRISFCRHGCLRVKSTMLKSQQVGRRTTQQLMLQNVLHLGTVSKRVLK